MDTTNPTPSPTQSGQLVRAIPARPGLTRGEFLEFPRSVILYQGRVYAPYGGAITSDDAHQLGAALIAAAIVAGHDPDTSDTVDRVSIVLPSPIQTPTYCSPDWVYLPHRAGRVAAHQTEGLVMAGIEVTAARAWTDGVSLIAAARSARTIDEAAAA